LFSQVVGFDLSPEFSFPVIILEVHQGNEIPQDFEVLQVGKTLLQRLVVSSLELEQVFKFSILLGFQFECLKLNIVVVNLLVNFKDFLDAHRVIVGVGQVGFELILEFLHFYAKCIELLLDFNCLITDDVDDILFNFVDLFLGLIEASFRCLD
jgi:hypothetical protein